MLVNQVSPVFWRVETFRFCMCDEMPCPDGDVANFIVKNARENPGTAQIALRAYAEEHGGTDIEPARFEYHGHHCEPRANIMPGPVSRFPQACMGG